MQLTRPPRGAITVRAVSSDPSEGRASEPVVFDRSNWEDAQTIVITGVDDQEADGDVKYQVRFEASGAHPHDEPRLRAVLTFVNRDVGDVATFAGLGDLPGGVFESSAADLSADGAVVVGVSVGAEGREAVRFTRAEGLVGLGAAPSRATGVSPDGSLVTGVATGGESYAGPGAVWRVGEAPELVFLQGDEAGAPPGLPPWMELVDPRVVLDDGTVFGLCQQYGNPIPGPGCRQDGPGDIELLAGSIVLAADALFNYGGELFGNRYGDPPLTAILNGDGVPYPEDAFCITPGFCSAALQAFSRDAAIAVGTSEIYPPRPDVYSEPGELEETAWLYTSNTGLTERLPDLAGGDQASGAYDISADGRVVGGYGTDASGQRAVLWIDREVFAVEALLAAQGGAMPEGFVLLEVRALSADGLTLAGNGVNADGSPEGFVIELRTLP